MTILAVFQTVVRHRILETAASRAGWGLLHANSFDEARAMLSNTAPGVVLCEEVMEDGSWRDLLECDCVKAGSTRLIVTSRLAGASLWAEVLNLGGYDVLAQPFDESEVMRILGPPARH